MARWVVIVLFLVPAPGLLAQIRSQGASRNEIGGSQGVGSIPKPRPDVGASKAAGGLYLVNFLDNNNPCPSARPDCRAYWLEFSGVTKPPMRYDGKEMARQKAQDMRLVVYVARDLDRTQPTCSELAHLTWLELVESAQPTVVKTEDSAKLNNRLGECVKFIWCENRGTRDDPHWQPVGLSSSSLGVLSPPRFEGDRSSLRCTQ
jgi:hypothetical protein